MQALFTDADEIREWLDAACFEAETARMLADAGVTPDQAGKISDDSIAGYEGTFGYKLSSNDLTLEDVLDRIWQDTWPAVRFDAAALAPVGDNGQLSMCSMPGRFSTAVSERPMFML